MPTYFEDFGTTKDFIHEMVNVALCPENDALKQLDIGLGRLQESLATAM